MSIITDPESLLHNQQFDQGRAVLRDYRGKLVIQLYHSPRQPLTRAQVAGMEISEWLFDSWNTISEADRLTWAPTPEDVNKNPFNKFLLQNLITARRTNGTWQSSLNQQFPPRLALPPELATRTPAPVGTLFDASWPIDQTGTWSVIIVRSPVGEGFPGYNGQENVVSFLRFTDAQNATRLVLHAEESYDYWGIPISFDGLHGLEVQFTE